MKLIVFGATGGTGQEILKQALAAGHEVRAFVRNPDKIFITHPGLQPIVGDVLNAPLVEEAIAGQQAVISALGQTRPPTPDLLAQAATNILAGMHAHGVRRLISTTGAGVRALEDQPQFIDNLMKGLLTLMAGEVLRDSEANARLITASGLDWTIVRVPRLTDGPASGTYRVGYLGQGSGIQISRSDVADFILKELKGGTYIQKMPVISSR